MAAYYVYRNLRMKDTFSIKQRGKVVHRLTHFVAHDVQFKVSNIGRQRVLRERQKNVHAFVVAQTFKPSRKSGKGLQRISYNPYKAGTFIMNEKPILAAKTVLFSGGQCFLLEQ